MPPQYSEKKYSGSESEYVVSCDGGESSDDGSTADPSSDDDFEIDSASGDVRQGEEMDIDPPAAPELDAQGVSNLIRRLDGDPSGLDIDDDEEVILYQGNRLPPEHYKKAMFDMDEDAYIRKEYAPGTERVIAMADGKWREFCSTVDLGDATEAYRQINFKIVFQFIDWCLNQTTGVGGRRKKGIRSKNSLVTFWCTFRLAFERSTTYKIDKAVDHVKMSNALIELGSKHNLTNEKRVNRSMTLSDLKEQLYTTIQTTKKSFNLGEVRILAVLYLLLLAPAGSRPQSILRLRFGDIRILLARDPKGGPHRLLIKFTLEFTKRYLGKKAAKTFFLPEIIFDSSLLLSPHVFLLGILFRHRAFRSELLNNDPHALSKLDIYKGEHELLLPLKEELNDVFVFRRAVRTREGYRISDKAPITQSQISGIVHRIGELGGFEYPTISYSLRYKAGNSMDRSIDVSQALRNLVMDHAPGSDTFEKHYLNRHICMDIYAISRGEELQQELIERSASHGHSRSSRRPANLSTEESKALNEHPTLVRLTAKLKDLPYRSEEHRALRLKIRSKKAQLFTQKKQELRRQWTEKQALLDCERQLEGVGFEPLVTGDGAAENARPLHPLQQRLLDALAAPLKLVDADVEAMFLRRARAINAIVDYCSVEEMTVTKVVAPARLPPEMQQRPPAENSRILVSKELRASVMVQKSGERLRRCFLCIGKALRLKPGDPLISEYCRDHYNATGVTRHFRRVHLSKLGPRERTVCPVCVPVVRLEDKQHLQSHADTVHGIRTSFVK